MTDVWTETQNLMHLAVCPDKMLIRSGDGNQWERCGCGETSRHTAWAVALAEIDRDCYQPVIYEPPWRVEP